MPARLKRTRTKDKRYAGYVFVSLSATYCHVGFKSSGIEDESRATARTNLPARQEFLQNHKSPNAVANPERMKKYWVRKVPKRKMRIAERFSDSLTSIPAH